jgi:hypothetical protein
LLEQRRRLLAVAVAFAGLPAVGLAEAECRELLDVLLEVVAGKREI